MVPELQVRITRRIGAHRPALPRSSDHTPLRRLPLTLGECPDTPSAPCVPVNQGQDIYLRAIEDIGHARERARPILNRVLRKTGAGARWSLNFILLPNRPRTAPN